MEKAARFLADGILEVPPILLELRQRIRAVALEVNAHLRDVDPESLALGKVCARARNAWPIPHGRTPWAYVTVSLGHDAASGLFGAFPGEVFAEVGYQPDAWLPGSHAIGGQASLQIRPRRTKGWPAAIAAARQHVGRRWLCASESRPAGAIDDFEYHEERTARPRNPEIKLFTGIQWRPPHQDPEAKATREAGERRRGVGWRSKPLRASSMQGVRPPRGQAMGCANHHT